MTPLRTSRRSAALRKIRNILIAIIVITLLLIAAGLAYSYYTASLASDQPQAAAPKLEQRKEISPTAPNPTAQVGVATSTMELPVQPGKNALFSVRTNAKATCDITVTYGAPGEEENQSRDQGLSRKVADAFGSVSWTWTVEPARPLGAWPIEVTCFNDVNVGYLRAKLIVANEE